MSRTARLAVSPPVEPMLAKLTDVVPVDGNFLYEPKWDGFRAVVDGEIVMPTPHGLDFGGLQMRLHPAASRVAMLAQKTPAAFVAFDLLAAGGKNLMSAPQEERRKQLEQV